MMVLTDRISKLIAATAVSVIALGAPALLAQTPAPIETPAAPVEAVAPAPVEVAAPAAADPVERLPSETVEQFLLRASAAAPGSVATQVSSVIKSSSTALLELIAFTKTDAAQTLKPAIRDGLEATIDADADGMAKTIEALVITNGAVNQAVLGEMIAFARTETGEPLGAFLGDALALIADKNPGLAPSIRVEVARSELASLKESFADSIIETAAGPGAAGGAGGGGGSIGGAGAGAAGGGATSGGADFENGGTVQTAGISAPVGGGDFSMGTTSSSNVSPSSP